MQCPRCRHENPARAKFCLECGQRLAGTCAACGTELPETAKFCPECGHAVAAGARGRGAAGDRAGPPHTGHVHAAPPRRANPHLAQRAGRRAEARQRALLRPGRLHGAGRAIRSRGHARPRERVLRDRARRGPPLRGHGQPVPRRRVHGALRRAAGARGSRAPRGARRPRRRARAPGPPRGRRSRDRDRPDRPDGSSHRVRPGGLDRRQPAHGLHGGRRHDAPGRPPPADGRARRDPRQRGDVAARRGLRARRARGSRQPCEAAASPSWCSGSSASAHAARRSRAERAGPEPLRRARPRARVPARPLRRRRGRPGPGRGDRRRARRSGSRGSCSSSGTASPDRRVAYLEGRCLSYGAAIPYVPVARPPACDRCGLGEADPPEAIAEKARATLRELGWTPTRARPTCCRSSAHGAPNGALEGLIPRRAQGTDVRHAAPDVRCARAARGRSSWRSRTSTGRTGRRRNTSPSSPKAWPGRPSC